MTTRRSYSAIPVSLLRRCRMVLSRGTDAAGRVIWIAEIPSVPWCRATGSSRIEALDRVRKIAERRRDDGGLRRGPPTEGPDDSESAQRG